MNIRDIWATVLQKIEQEIYIGPLQMGSYFYPLEPVAIADDELILCAPSLFVKNIVMKSYGDYLNALIADIDPRIRCRVVESHEAERYRQTASSDAAEKSEGDLMPSIVSSPPTADIASRLSPKFRFENFVVGDSNLYAHATAWAISKNPGTIYNPFFIYGKSGLGKTHLMQAVGFECLKQHPDMRIRYVLGEQFVNEFIYSIRNARGQEFRDRYRKLDLLIIDDIQSIENKPSCSEEFFNTFNTLFMAQKQIIIASDRLPKELRALEDRLLTRFESGIVAEIGLPNYEHRLAILQRLGDFTKIKLPDAIVASIAQNVTTSIRILESSFKRVYDYALIRNVSYDEALSIVLSEMLHAPKETISIDDIVECVARSFGVTPEDIRGSKQTQKISLARHVAMYITRQLTDLSMPTISSSFGNRTHGSVSKACSKIQARTSGDKEFKRTISRLISEIKGQRN